MDLLDLTLADIASNMALDEALVDEADEAATGAAEGAAGGESRETLRLWEAPQWAVVLGRSSVIAEEVDLAYCHQAGIPVLRRTSGGATVVIGPGCLMYAVLLSYRLRPGLRAIDAAHRFVLGTVANAVGSLGCQVEQLGTSDLAIGGRKFSGNSVRAKREYLIYHGTLLYDFEIAMAERCLKMPPRQPEYRRQRSHGDFLTNVPLSARRLRQALAVAWQAQLPRIEWPRERTAQLVGSRYANRRWNELGRLD